MNDRNALFDMLDQSGKLERELEAKRRQEKRDAEALAYDAIVYRDMPSDLRSRAREWGLEAFMCAVWSNAWQAGYMQRGRDERAKEQSHDNT